MYGVHAGRETLAQSQLMGFHKCELGARGAKKCIFDEKYYIYDVVAVTEALLVFQIEAHYSVNLSTNERVGGFRLGLWLICLIKKATSSIIKF